MKRIICSQKVNASMTADATRAVKELKTALRNLYNVMDRWEGNLEQLLNDPSYYDATIEEIQHLESFGEV